MSGWGPEGPPEEAYGRVTDPERFRGLHRAGRDLLTELTSTYSVERVLAGPSRPVEDRELLVELESHRSGR